MICACEQPGLRPCRYPVRFFVPRSTFVTVWIMVKKKKPSTRRPFVGRSFLTWMLNRVTLLRGVGRKREGGRQRNRHGDAVSNSMTPSILALCADSVGLHILCGLKPSHQHTTHSAMVYIDVRIRLHGLLVLTS